MLDMRLRLPELMQRAGIKNAYQLARASRGEMTFPLARRLVKAEGKPERIELRTLDLLCTTLNAKPWELFESDDEPLPPSITKKR